MEKGSSEKQTSQDAVAYAPATELVQHKNRALVAAHWFYFVVFGATSLVLNATLFREHTPVYTGFSKTNSGKYIGGVYLLLENILKFFSDNHVYRRLVAYVNVLLFVSALVSLRLVTGQNKHTPSTLLKVIAVGLYVPLAVSTFTIIAAVAYHARDQNDWEHRNDWAYWFILLLCATTFYFALHGMAIFGMLAGDKPAARRCLPYSTVREATI